MVVFPLIVPGVEGRLFTDTAKVLIADDPHALLALTVTVPPEAPEVAVMELVAELPVHPTGNAQLYEVAPLTAVTL